MQLLPSPPSPPFLSYIPLPSIPNPPPFLSSLSPSSHHLLPPPKTYSPSQPPSPSSPSSRPSPPSPSALPPQHNGLDTKAQSRDRFLRGAVLFLRGAVLFLDTRLSALTVCGCRLDFRNVVYFFLDFGFVVEVVVGLVGVGDGVLFSVAV